MLKDKKSVWRHYLSSPYLGWALLLFATITAAFFRFWELGQLPPGLYRDEAINGLDALKVLQGQHAFFFPANNGREPLYIYLTSLSISLFGRSAAAVRLAAAVIGTLTTLATYLLAKSWFGRRVGMLSAWTWAVTLWPVHLSRVGLRPILAAPLLAVTFWSGTLAYRTQQKRHWFLSGLVYGAAFYTYLAVRFTPLLLLLFGVYLLLTGRWSRLKSGLPWFCLGAALALAPLLYLSLQQPDLILGRTGQVSFLNPDVNQGDPWGTLGTNGIRALGLFLWKGDTILRHNPAGRPLFDLFAAVPFVAGLFWCLRQWRRPEAMGLLLWVGVMLGPTIMAEDTPHFLRAAGLLPAVVAFPAIALGQLWSWRSLPPLPRQLLVILLLAATSYKTASDYIDYGNQTDVAYLFETAATELAQQIKEETASTAIYLDERLWSDKPSIEFLVNEQPVSLFRPETGLPDRLEPELTIYGWPYGPLDYVPQAVRPPALITVENGGLARGDLDESANPLYVRFAIRPVPEGLTKIVASFEDQLQLSTANIRAPSGDKLEIDLYWRTERVVQQDLAVFVHLLEPDGSILAQDDGLLAEGRWPRQWWLPGLLIQDRRTIELPQPYDAARQQLQIGLYDIHTGVRLSVMDQAGHVIGDAWPIEE